jgi:pyruvate,orthophosphate dikinase
MTDSRVFRIGCRNAEDAVAHGAETMGFKAFNLWRMARLKLPVPPAFVLSVDLCRDYFRDARATLPEIRALLASHVKEIEEASGLRFGDARKPLLVAVRSGAPVSMPGMLETVLDIGLCDASVRGLIRLTGNPRLAWDSYRRLVQSYAEVVYGASAREFDAATRRLVAKHELEDAGDLDFKQLQELTVASLDLHRRVTGRAFPQRPMDQLETAVVAVFDSWSAPKALEYRRLHDLSDDLGTAVTVQAMVFGNAGATSGSGVAFTRDPATGDNRLYFDFLSNAQGEDVVSGRHGAEDAAIVRDVFPDIHQEIGRVAKLLEHEFGEMQEFEFTLQDGKLFLLQTRDGKRTALAALRIAVERVADGSLTPEKALLALQGIDLDAIETVRCETGSARLIAEAIAAGGGVATGAIALSDAAAKKLAASGQRVILVRKSAATEDIAGVATAAGLLAGTGGRTSHIAVVARQMNKACLVGCTSMRIDLARGKCRFAAIELSEGDIISIDGSSGAIYAGAVEMVVEKPAALLEEVARWERSARASRAPPAKKPARAA